MAKILKTILDAAVMLVTILSAHLLTSTLYGYLLTYKRQADPYTFTAVGMLVIAVVFYPTMKIMEHLIKKGTLDLFRKGRNRFGRGAGIFIVFVLLLGVLYYLYAEHWYHINVLKGLWRKLQ